MSRMTAPGLSYRLALAMLGWALCIGAPVDAADPPLDLTDQPTANGASIAPNILVAVDNSGSMDFETLFDNRSIPTNSTLKLNEDGLLSYQGNPYAYLFPNGYRDPDDDRTRGRRLYGDAGSGIEHAIPPIPQLAFARSSAYNKSYFDPAVAVDGGYTPWVNASGTSTYANLDSASQWAATPYDPTQSLTIDLTRNQRSTQSGYQFFVTSSMSSAGVTYYQRRCLLIFCNYDWLTDDGPYASFGFNGTAAIEYFPATFYMPNSWTPPAAFGWSGGYDRAHPEQNIVGRGPDNTEALKRYRLEPGNFTNSTYYARAMTQFANWFAYYRKRNLAIRGGITAAFDNIRNVRVGSCSINQALDRAQNGQYRQLSMQDLSDDSKRGAFYRSIYSGMDFYQALGTPNRPALYYLGKELETNPNIIQSPCQRNYAILFTDGFNSASVDRIGNIDGQYDGGDPAKSPIPDRYSDTIADIAMRFYKTLQPPDAVDIKNQLIVPAGCPEDRSLDCETSLHMSTFAVTLGQQGAIFGRTDQYPGANANPFSSPPPWYKTQAGHTITDGSLPTGGLFEIDDLWHATINSRGALLNAASPQDIASRFTSALNQILGRGETLTNATGNGRTLANDSQVYQTRYRTTDWSGDLIAYRAIGGSAHSGQYDWSAAARLPGFTRPSDDTRTIVTALREDDNAQSWQVRGIPFTEAALGNGPIDNLNGDKIRYLRGDRRLEQFNGGPFRNRPNDSSGQGQNTVLGDIIHATPTYVGAPQPLNYVGFWRDRLHPALVMPENNTPYYSARNADAFANRLQARRPMVYVGANDGMLHAFDADTGQERLAFVPNAVLHDIGATRSGLTSPQYTHRSYVDGQTTVGDVFFDNAWHTMLVGGLRNGGRTLYGLDITDPAQFTESRADQIVKWEFRDPMLGQTFGQPIIARLHNGEWAALFGNGYNSDGGGATLFIVDIDDGHLIKRLTTPALADGARPGNGLSSPAAADLDNDHIADYVYAGDYAGNVWKFDLTASSTSGWTASRLFQARRASDSGAAQPITTAPVVSAHPNGARYGVMVYVGTGQDVTAISSKATRPSNSFYGLWDPAVFSYAGPPGLPTAAPTIWRISRSQLVTQSVQTNRTINDTSYRIFTSRAVSYAGNGSFKDRGWAFDLPDGLGEAILTTPHINTRQSRVEFATTIIDPQTCTLTSSGYFMALDMATGGTPASFVFDINGDGIIDSRDNLDTSGRSTLIGGGVAIDNGSVGDLARFVDHDSGTTILVGTTTGNAPISLPLSDRLFRGRKTWREIRQ